MTGTDAMKHRLLMSFVSALFMCACVAGASDVKEWGLLSSKMVNLSSAVDTYFADLAEAPIDNDVSILQKATVHDPGLLAPEFAPYLLKVQYQKSYAVLLLCSKDGGRTIMEDAGCSARLDRQVTHVEPCKFTLLVKQGCQVEGGDPE